MPRQEQLIDERPKNKAIEEAAEKVRDITKRRISIQKDEADARKKLKELLEKEGIKAYSYEAETEDGEEQTFDVVLEVKEKAMVRKHKDPSEGEGEEE